MSYHHEISKSGVLWATEPLLKNVRILGMAVLYIDSGDECEEFDATTTDRDNTEDSTDDKRQPKSKRRADFLYDGMTFTC